MYKTQMECTLCEHGNKMQALLNDDQAMKRIHKWEENPVNPLH